MGRTWHETDHPRNPRNGEFVDKEGWAGRVATTMLFGGRGDGYQPGRNRIDELDYGKIAPLVTQRWGQQPDRMLGAIYDEQGFHGRPRVVTAEEMDELVQAGWTELWRGLASGDVNQMRTWADQFRGAGEHHPGQGARGGGTYTSTDLGEAQTYTQMDRNRFQLVLIPDDSGQLMHGYQDATDPDSSPIPYDQYNKAGYYNPKMYPGILRIALRPDARTIAWEDLDATWERLVGKVPDESPRYQVLADEGRLAAALGYDAIVLRRGHVIVLNRTAVAVQEGES